MYGPLENFLEVEVSHRYLHFSARCVEVLLIITGQESSNPWNFKEHVHRLRGGLPDEHPRLQAQTLDCPTPVLGL